MKITDISTETESLYYCCLEDWSEEMQEAGDHKQKWYVRMKDKGIRVKFALNENGVVGGMIQYLPIEHSIFQGQNLNVVLCVWVHGHKEGRGDFQGKGMGKALLKAAEQDSMQSGVNGLVAWGLAIPAFMRASWYRKQGYRVVDKSGIMRLLWKPFNENAVPPKFIKPLKKPGKTEGKVNISIFRNGWCPAMNLAYERAKRAALDFGDKVEINEYDTTDKEVMEEWGIPDALYFDGKEVRTGPPPTYRKIRKKLGWQIRRKKGKPLRVNGFVQRNRQ